MEKQTDHYIIGQVVEQPVPTAPPFSIAEQSCSIAEQPFAIAEQVVLKDKKRNGGCWLYGIVGLGLIVLIIGVGLGVALGGGGGEDPIDDDPSRLYTSVGCFFIERNFDIHYLTGPSFETWVRQCSSKCSTRYFGVTQNDQKYIPGDALCSCFVEVPDKRVAIGSCIINEQNQYMELYFNQEINTMCSQERTEKVRNFLVEEDDAPFGFDIVSNSFRSSPFDLYKDECGTNIYKVQTEISEGNLYLETSTDEVKSFALDRRNERSSSWETSADEPYRNALSSALASVSASFDQEQVNLFQSSGAAETTSRVFISTGLKRLMEVKMVDFNSSYRFVTLSKPFGNALRSYMNSGFQKDKAYEIIKQYGQFVLTRGTFGGYMQLRTSMLGSDVSNMSLSEQELLHCYEASVSDEASGFGFDPKGSVGEGSCTQEAVNKFKAGRDVFLEEVSEQIVVGGRKACSTCEEFVVEAQDATLLTSNDKYPPDEGVRFRLLSDFLAADKISPLDVKRLQITEDQFDEIHTFLQGHILEYLQQLERVIDDCNCFASALPYLQQDDQGQHVCMCYTPHEPKSFITISLKPDRTFSKEGNRRTCAWDRCPSEKMAWTVSGDCECVNGLNSCFMDGAATTVQVFSTANLTPVTGESNLWKLEGPNSSTITTPLKYVTTPLAFGRGKDCASGGRCFTDQLRGGFVVDLTDTGFEFDERTKITVSGWSPRMRVVADGVQTGVYERIAAPADVEATDAVPSGTKILTVQCGGWCGVCVSELYVRIQSI